MRETLKRLVPKRLQPAGRRVYYFPADVLDYFRGRRDPLVPPRGIAHVGGGDFRKIGERSLAHFVKFGGLRPDDRVLDVGCGVGRMAAPLTRYLSPDGSYEGFDIVPKEIEWCKRNIAPRFPNFRFQVADIQNKEYNPWGKVDASEYEFPYEDASFDFVILTSVFTHLLPEEVNNYLSEIRRVLKPGGRCFVTFFLLNDESLRLIGEEQNTISFDHNLGSYRIKDKDTPENAVAYDEPYVYSLYKRYDLRIEEPVRYGSWSGRRGGADYQDILVASKI